MMLSLAIASLPHRPQMSLVAATALKGFLASVSEAKGRSAPSRVWRSSSTREASDWADLAMVCRMGSAEPKR